MLKKIGILLVCLLVSGCSMVEVSTQQALPKTDSAEVKIALFALQNYTDTPQAGERAANLVEGVLLAEGYDVVNLVEEKYRNQTITQLAAVAQQNGASYFLSGGVSEWRYKTGIDGEPAVSLQCKLYESGSGKIVWSATASDNSWGNASIGTTALRMIEAMFDQ